jgi:hypothetical protein
MKWKFDDYQLLTWATEDEISFFGQSGQAYTSQRKAGASTSFSFKLPNQTVIRLEPDLIGINMFFIVYLNEELFDDITDTKQIKDIKLRKLLEIALADFAAKAAVNRDLLKTTRGITERQKAAKQAALLKKLD